MEGSLDASCFELLPSDLRLSHQPAVGWWELEVNTGALTFDKECQQLFSLPECVSIPTDSPPILEQVHPEDRSPLVNVFINFIRHPDLPCEVDFRVRKNRNQWHWIRSNAKATRFTDDGSAAHIVGCLHLIEPTSKSHLLSEILEGTTDGILVADASFRIKAVNNAFLEATGFDRLDIHEQTPELLRSTRHNRAFYLAILQSAKLLGEWTGEIWIRSKKGADALNQMSVKAIRNPCGGISQYLVFCRKCSQFTEIVSTSAHEMLDELTGLPDRRQFMQVAAKVLREADYFQTSPALLLVDLADFKTFNNCLGHSIGDALIEQVARRLRQVVGRDIYISKLRGDEFAIFLDKCTSGGYAISVAEKVLKCFDSKFYIESETVYLQCNIGIALSDRPDCQPSQLLDNSELAMHHSRLLGANNHHLYAESLKDEYHQTLKLGFDLKDALAQSQFHLYYQPQVSLNAQQFCGAEALIRWHHPKMGVISPSKFIPMAEQNGLIAPMGEWVINEACRCMQQWHVEGLYVPKVSVNISPKQFDSTYLPEVITRALIHSGADPRRLEIEVTESALFGDEDAAIRCLTEIAQLGVTIAIDDFGTGFSSLSYLKRLPIHKLKIDASFIRGLPDDDDDAKIVKSIIALADSMGLEVISEGVENLEQERFLRAYGCGKAQGYLYSRPVPETMVRGLLVDGIDVSGPLYAHRR